MITIQMDAEQAVAELFAEVAEAPGYTPTSAGSVYLSASPDRERAEAAAALQLAGWLNVSENPDGSAFLSLTYAGWEKWEELQDEVAELQAQFVGRRIQCQL